MKRSRASYIIYIISSNSNLLQKLFLSNQILTELKEHKSLQEDIGKKCKILKTDVVSWVKKSATMKEFALNEHHCHKTF